jgi:hypothetical protein
MSRMACSRLFLGLTGSGRFFPAPSATAAGLSFSSRFSFLTSGAAVPPLGLFADAAVSSDFFAERAAFSSANLFSS